MEKITYLDMILNETEPCSLAAMLFEDYDGDEYSIVNFLNNLGIQYPMKEVSKIYPLFNKIILTQKGKITVYNFLKEHGVIHEADSDLGGS